MRREGPGHSLVVPPSSVGAICGARGVALRAVQYQGRTAPDSNGAGKAVYWPKTRPPVVTGLRLPAGHHGTKMRDANSEARGATQKANPRMGERTAEQPSTAGTRLRSAPQATALCTVTPARRRARRVGENDPSDVKLTRLQLDHSTVRSHGRGARAHESRPRPVRSSPSYPHACAARPAWREPLPAEGRVIPQIWGMSDWQVVADHMICDDRASNML